MRDILDSLCAGRSLSRESAAELFTRFVRGEVGEVEISALLVALKSKSETPEEIAGAAEALRSAALPFPSEGMALADTCGTGGDGCHSVNISTAVALLAAECGMTIAKHGNRAMSSRSGIIAGPGVSLIGRHASVKRDPWTATGVNTAGWKVGRRSPLPASGRFTTSRYWPCSHTAAPAAAPPSMGASFVGPLAATSATPLPCSQRSR